MAQYEKPIPSLFATIHQYPPGEVERMNEHLVAQYSKEVMIDQAAEAILRVLDHYVMPIKGRGWRPLNFQTQTPWRSRLEAYTFGGGDAAEAGNLFVNWCERLKQADPDYVGTAKEIFSWGRVSPRDFTADQIRLVAATANSGQVPDEPVPWSSSFTKIAAAATHAADLDPRSRVLPQVIWDSRVSYAVANLASKALAREPLTLEFLQKHLLVVPGRGGHRKYKGEWHQAITGQGWSFATGSWQSRHNRFWISQIVGSRIIHGMAGKLNSMPAFSNERCNGHRWTSFDVALALFVEGY